MRDRLKRLGFTHIETIDDDLGRSASGSAERAGFDRMVAQVCLGKVGAVAAWEVSRFSRNSRDWQQLIEMCRVVDTVLVDQEAVYAPRQVNDRLLLGLLCGAPHNEPICSAAHYVGQQSQPTVNTSFFLTLPDIIFVLQIAFSCSSRPTVAFHLGSSPASPGQVDFIASSLVFRSTSA